MAAQTCARPDLKNNLLLGRPRQPKARAWCSRRAGMPVRGLPGLDGTQVLCRCRQNMRTAKPAMNPPAARTKRNIGTSSFRVPSAAAWIPKARSGISRQEWRRCCRSGELWNCLDLLNWSGEAIAADGLNASRVLRIVARDFAKKAALTVDKSILDLPMSICIDLS